MMGGGKPRSPVRLPFRSRLRPFLILKPDQSQDVGHIGFIRSIFSPHPNWCQYRTRYWQLCKLCEETITARTISKLYQSLTDAGFPVLFIILIWLLTCGRQGVEWLNDIKPGAPTLSCDGPGSGFPQEISKEPSSLSNVQRHILIALLLLVNIAIFVVRGSQERTC